MKSAHIQKTLDNLRTEIAALEAKRAAAPTQYDEDRFARIIARVQAMADKVEAQLNA